MIHIDNRLLDLNIEKAKKSERKRINHNFHNDLNDPFQRMLNTIEPESYCRPHKHSNPPKREVFIILKGKAVVIEFDDNGEVVDKIILKPEKGEFGVEIPPHTWHTIISLESGTIVYECKDGPYIPLTDKDFATWAPEEGKPKSMIFMKDLLKTIKLQ
jgi:cupin fold WbuC family metalloprotein